MFEVVVTKSHLREQVDGSSPAYFRHEFASELHLKHPSAAAEGIQEISPNLSL
jgi:hypothetical protein